jgi:hypothetical protein
MFAFAGGTTPVDQMAGLLHKPDAIDVCPKAMPALSNTINTIHKRGVAVNLILVLSWLKCNRDVYNLPNLL